MQNRNERSYDNRHRSDSQQRGGQNFRRNFRTKYDAGNRRPNNSTAVNYRRVNGRTVSFDNNNFQRRGTGRRFRYNNANLNDRRITGNTNQNAEADETQWFKITIPHGVKSGKTQLFSNIMALCDKSFTPFNYQEEGQASIFYVIGKDTSDMVRACNRRIKSPNGFTYTVTVSRVNVPFLNDTNAELIGHLKEAMSRRYDLTQRVLNLSDFRNDTYLQENGLFVSLARNKMLLNVIRIITENIPDIMYLNLSQNHITNLEPLVSLAQYSKLLKYLDISKNKLSNAISFDYLKGLNLEEILLAGNTVISTYKTHEDFVSSIRSIFPKLVKLDDEILPAQIKFDVEDEKDAVLPPIRGSYIPDDTRDFIMGFINQYYTIYDSDNRQPLMEAYHEKASFSFSIYLHGLQNKQKINAHFPFKMFQESRNLLHVKDRAQQKRLLKCGKLTIVQTLMDFPRTKHELDSFTIDVFVINPGLMNVVINGILREIDVRRERRTVQTRSFSRAFLIIPNLIINDILIMSNATVEQIQKYGKDNTLLEQLSIQPSTSSSSNLSLSPASTMLSVGGDENEMKVRQLSQATGMNLKYSADCLRDFNFNLDEALQACQALRDMIPAEAFQ